MSGSGDDREIRKGLLENLAIDAFFGVRSLPGKINPKTQAQRGGKAISPEQKQGQLAALAKQMGPCNKCPLHADRTKMVFGEGNAAARVVFVGEAPGFEEDRTGRPFVGRAGQLLTDIIVKGMGLKREDVYICNVLKCRPPENRTPSPQEIVACSPYLFEQLKIIRPELIIALGLPATQTLLETTGSMGSLRGRFCDLQLGDGDQTIPVMPTYHPAYLLRNPPAKPKVWEDIKKALKFLNLPVPGK